jgi:hypothetical protein
VILAFDADQESEGSNPSSPASHPNGWFDARDLCDTIVVHAQPRERHVTLREIQQPIKDRYRDEPAAADITLRAVGTITDGAMSCLGRPRTCAVRGGSASGCGRLRGVGLLR